MDNTQPDALRLADALEDGTYLLSVERNATAAELRRLHAECEAREIKALSRAARCQCGDRPAAQCPGAWEPGCDLGNNEKYVRVAAPAAEQAEPVAWAWALTKQLEKREATTRGYLRFSNPQNSSWEPLFRKAPAPARQEPLTEEQITAMRQAGYLDADDYPEAWSYERGVRDAERAHGISQGGE